MTMTVEEYDMRPPPSGPRPAVEEIAAGALQEHAAGAARPAEPPAWLARWTPVSMATMTEPPPVRRWLLRHLDRDGHDCAPGQGDGFLSRGKVGLLCAEGGLGKTYVLIELAICIVTGRRWLDAFEVDPAARKGKVLLGLAEEDIAEARRRMWEVGLALRLTPAEQQKCTEQIVLLPLAGCPVALTALERRTPVESPMAGQLRAQLTSAAGEHGWSLIVLDPLARWAGAEAETSNESATRYVQTIETLTESPGEPTVLVAHHTPQVARRTGEATSRGVTGLVDGARWVASMTCAGKGRVDFALAKSNYSRPMAEPIHLVKDGRRLRAQSPDEAAAHRETQGAASKATAEVEIQQALQQIVAFLRDCPEHRYPGSPDTLIAALGIKPRTVGRAAFAQGQSSGLTGAPRIKVGGTTRDRYIELL